MPRLYMVRHGEPAGTFSTEVDPGLSPLGHKQAEAVAETLAARIGKPIRLFSSPLRRAQETSAPLARLWRQEVAIEQRVAEIPSPFAEPSARGSWIKDILSSRFDRLEPGLQSWRGKVAEAIAGQAEDAVFFSHFVAINAAAGVALDDPRVTIFRPGHCSVTVFDTGAGGLRLVEKGLETPSLVL